MAKVQGLIEVDARDLRWAGVEAGWKLVVAEPQGDMVHVLYERIDLTDGLRVRTRHADFLVAGKRSKARYRSAYTQLKMRT